MRDDREAMEAFCSATYPRLVGALALHCGDVHVAEELAQEALLRACRRWSRVSQLESPGGWAYRVGVNLASNHFRRLRAERRARQQAAASGTSAMAADQDVADRLAVRAALRKLTGKQREAIIMRFYLDLSAEQAATVLGTTAGAVRALSHRALQTLREGLGAAAAVEETADGS